MIVFFLRSHWGFSMDIVWWNYSPFHFNFVCSSNHWVNVYQQHTMAINRFIYWIITLWYELSGGLPKDIFLSDVMAGCMFLSRTQFLKCGQEQQREGGGGKKREILKPEESEKCHYIQINLEIYPKKLPIVEDIDTGNMDPLVFFLLQPHKYEELLQFFSHIVKDGYHCPAESLIFNG